MRVSYEVPPAQVARSSSPLHRLASRPRSLEPYAYLRPGGRVDVSQHFIPGSLLSSPLGVIMISVTLKSAFAN